MKYDLLTQPWIRAKMQDASYRQLSILQCFEQASDICKVEYDNPLAVASVYRLLLAIVYRAYGEPGISGWTNSFKQQEFDQQVINYLNQADVKDAFDLFSKDKPFFQTSGFVKDKTTSIKKLSPHYATANNKTLFFHANDSEDFSLPPEQAAVLLLVCQYFSLGGGVSGTSNLGKHSNFTNAPLIGGAFVWLTGDNLFQTLMFNYHKTDGYVEDNEDKAIWEQGSIDKFATYRSAWGVADYLTWQSRHIRLLPNEDGSVSEVYFAQGYATPANVTQRGEQYEPFFAYKQKQDGSSTKIRLSFERSLWRDSSALLNATLQDEDSGKKSDIRARGIQQYVLRATDVREILGDDFVASCELIALDNDKANPKGWYQESLPIYLKYFPENEQTQELDPLVELANAIQYAEIKFLGLRTAIRTFSSNFLVEGAKTEDVTQHQESTGYAGYYWPELDQHFLDLYRELLDNPEAAKQQWNKSCRESIRRAFELALEPFIGCGEKSYLAYAKAKHKLETELIGTQAFKYKENKVDDDKKQFVGYLLGLNSPDYKNREALAHLRRSLMDESGAWLSAFQYLTDQLPALEYQQDRRKSRRSIEWERRCYALAAGLFAVHGKVKQYKKDDEGKVVEPRFSFGLSVAKLRAGGADKLTSLDLRFKTLLQCEDEQLPGLLRGFFQMLKAKDIPVDYYRLLTDLLNWHHPKQQTQLQWATDFWAVHKQLEQNNEQGE